MARYIKTVSATGVSAPDPLTGDGALICGTSAWEPISVCCNWSTNLSSGCIYLTGNFGEYDSLIFEVNSFGSNCCCYNMCGSICFSSPNCSAYCYAATNCCPACCTWRCIPVGHHSTCASSHCIGNKCHITMPVYHCCGSSCGFGSFHVRFDRGTRLGSNGVCYDIRAESTITPAVPCCNNQAERYMWMANAPPTCFNYYWPEKDGAPEGNEWNGIHFTIDRSIMCPAFSGAKFGVWGQKRSKYPSANITSE